MGTHRYRRWRGRRIPVIAGIGAVILALTAAAAPAPGPTVTITRFDSGTVVVSGDHFPAHADVMLTATLVYDSGARFAGGQDVSPDASGHIVLGFLLPESPGAAGLIMVQATTTGISQTVSLAISPGASPLPMPSTPADGVAAPSDDSDVSGCPTADQLSGAPSGNSFSGHTYNGHGETLPPGTYTISSDTCIEDYVFDGANLTLRGSPSNVTVVNNTFQNWPAKQAIANVNGTDIHINYNTVRASSGGAWTGIFGQGAMTNVTVDHNDVQNLGAAVDGIQLRFTGGGSNVSVSYNRITQNGRFPIELQQVVHGLRVLHNYVSVQDMGGDQLGQISVATGNDMDGGGYYPTDTSGVEIAYNIVLDLATKTYPACFESRGNGNSLHDNYCRNYVDIDDYAMTNNSSPTPWYVTNNTILGPDSGGVSSYEGFNRSGYSPVSPTESGNQRYTLNDPNAPGVPAWNYAVGAQP